MSITYECSGIESLVLQAEEGNTITTETYGPIMPITIDCPPEQTSTLSTLRTKTVSSAVAPGSVGAHLLKYNWGISDIDGTGSPLETIQTTYHRVYTLQDKPSRIGWTGTKPWVPILEIGCNLAEGATGDWTVRAYLQEGIYNSLWTTKDMYFLKKLSAIHYDSGGASFVPVKIRFYVPLIFYSTPFYLADLLDYLQTSPWGKDALGFNCYSYNGLYLIVSNQLGTPLYGRFIARPIPPGESYPPYLSTKCLLPSGKSPKLDDFETHFAVTENWTPIGEGLLQGLFWDSSNKFHCSGGIVDPCDGSTVEPCPTFQNYYFYVKQIPQTFYLEYLFTNTDIYTKWYFFSSINKRR